MESASNLNSTRRSPSIWPLCSKNPTPALNSTTRFSGKSARGGSAARAGATAEQNSAAPIAINKRNDIRFAGDVDMDCLLV